MQRNLKKIASENISFPETQDSNVCSGFQQIEKTFQDEIVTDLLKNKWKIGQKIGKGSFGNIFSVSNKKKKNNNSDFVIKIEPHSNGPLFVEIHCLLNVWKSTGNDCLGIPKYIASGSHILCNQRYRFLILPKYDYDLFSVVKNHRLSIKSISILATHVLKILQCLHNKGYCHSDIKAENLMIKKAPANAHSSSPSKKNKTSGKYDLRKSTKLNRVKSLNDSEKSIFEDSLYLIDYGLASKFIDSFGNHKLSDPDERRAGVGTLEFTSCDAHNGIYSRRSDLECLGYNLIKWHQGYLPWNDLLTSEQNEKVHWMKEYLMSDVREILKHIYGENIPNVFGQFMFEVKKLAFDEHPRYETLCKIFEKQIKQLNLNYDYLFDDLIEFQQEIKDDTSKNLDMKTIMKNMGITTPLCEMNFNRVSPKLLRSKSVDNTLKTEEMKIDRSQQDLRKLSWKKVLNQNPEQLIRNRRKSQFCKDIENLTPIRRYVGKPTYAIIELEEKKKFKDRLNASINK